MQCHIVEICMVYQHIRNRQQIQPMLYFYSHRMGPRGGMGRRWSPPPRGRRSPMRRSPVRRRSRSPMGPRRGSRSPPPRRSRSPPPQRRGSRSPVRRSRSPAPARRPTRSPPPRRSRSPGRRRRYCNSIMWLSHACRSP